MKTKKIWITAIVALLMAAFVGACKDDNVGKVGLCPLVVSTDPAKLATGVPLDKIISITFNEAMDPRTITPGSLTLVDANGNGARVATVTGALAYNSSTFAMTYTPSAKLTPNTKYTGTVSSSVKDITGNALQTDFVWTFTTGTTLSPTVISTDPLNNAVGIPLNKIITATFNAPMNPTTITTTTFTVKQGATVVVGAVSYSGTKAFFKPTSPLTSNTLYTATITTGAKDVAGAPLASNYVWSFTTGIISAPTVLSTDPANLATGVPLNKVVSATFSEVMNPLTITTSSFTLMIGSTSVSGAVNYSGTTATFTPSANLLSGATYTATITTAAKNPAGTPLANDYVWTFNTNPTLGGPFVDLKSVARFGIIAGVGVSNNAGPSVINNLDVGIYPGVRSSVTGFPPATVVNGSIYASDDIAPPGVAAMLLQAKTDLTNAYLFAEGATAPAPAIISGDQGGKTLAPGIYKSTSSLLIQLGDLTLDAQGDANAVWIFQIASGFTTVGIGPYPSSTGGNVKLTGGAQAKNVFWQVASSATIGDYTSFQGNILALSDITMNTGAQAVGRMLARNGSVVMTGTNIINKP